jgi:hypothetical protein
MPITTETLFSNLFVVEEIFAFYSCRRRPRATCYYGRKIDWRPVNGYVPLSKRTHRRADQATDTVHVFWGAETSKRKKIRDQASADVPERHNKVQQSPPASATIHN